MAYMPLNKDEFYLDTSKMTRIYDLSQPWGWDTPLWPFPGPRADLTFPRGQYLERFHKRTCTYTGTQCYTNEDIRKCSAGTDCRKCR